MKKDKFVQNKRMRSIFTNIARSPTPWIKIPAISLFMILVWLIVTVFFTVNVFMSSRYTEIKVLPWYINLPIFAVIVWGFMSNNYISGLRELIWEYPVAYQRHIKLSGNRSISRSWTRNILHLFFASWMSLLIIWVFYLMPMTPAELEMGIFTTFLPGFLWFLGIFLLLKIGERVVFIRKVLLETRLLNLLAVFWLPMFCSFTFWLFFNYPYTVPP